MALDTKRLFAAALPCGLVVCAALGCSSSTAEGPTTSTGSGAAAGAAGHGTGGSGDAGAGGTGTGGTGGGATGGAGGGSCVPTAPPVPDACIDDVSAADLHTYSCDGLSYRVSVPAACTSCACGLVFDVHGFTMNGAMEEHNTGLAALGRAHGYLVVQPTAPGAVPSWTAATDDARVFAFLERMRAAFHVDPKRIHFTGFSQGGSMTWRMLCDHSDVLASVAPGAFNAWEDQCFTFGNAPPHVRPILYLHGTADALVAFSTATATRDAVVAAEGMVDGGVVESDADHLWQRFVDGQGGVFEFLQHDYLGAPVLGGHCYPGSTDPGGEPGQVFSFACQPPNAFVWGQAVMQFFLDHPLP
ncbi:MAG: hypothetical protein IT373_22585 [Polyangiaceae bacterium]|nr:hypothetical protein [Polyangiaceae bacterium]